MLHFLVDWAERWDWRSEGVSPGRLVEAVQRGQRVGIYQDVGRTDWWPAQQPLPAGIERIAHWPPASSYDLVVVISDRLFEFGVDVAKTVVYRPRTLTLGVMGLSVAEPQEFDRIVVEFFKQQGLSLASLTALATPRGDTGTPILYDWAETQRLPLLEYAPERLALLRPSQVGSDNRWWETEAAAMLAASTRKLLVPATVCQGWTLAVARRQTG